MWSTDGVYFSQLLACQHTLTRPRQLVGLIESIANGVEIPKVKIGFDGNEKRFWIDNGHHRCMAFWLAGYEFIPWDVVSLYDGPRLRDCRSEPFIKYAERHSKRLGYTVPCDR